MLDDLVTDLCIVQKKIDVKNGGEDTEDSHDSSHIHIYFLRELGWSFFDIITAVFKIDSLELIFSVRSGAT